MGFRTKMEVPLVASSFGESADVDCLPGIVICGWSPRTALKPLRVSLSHQLYKTEVDELLRTWDEIHVIEYRKIVLVAKREQLPRNKRSRRPQSLKLVR